MPARMSCRADETRGRDGRQRCTSPPESLERRLSSSIGRLRLSRVRSVNTAFSALRTLLPTERKLSKIETLKLASNYINHLLALLLVGADDRPCARLLLRHAHDDGHDDDQLRDDACDEATHASCAFCSGDCLDKDYNLNMDSHMLPNFNNADKPTHPPAF